MFIVAVLSQANDKTTPDDSAANAQYNLHVGAIYSVVQAIAFFANSS